MVTMDEVIREVREEYERHPRDRYFILFSGGRDSVLATYAVLSALSDEFVTFDLVYVDHEMDFPWMRLAAFRALEDFSRMFPDLHVHVLTPPATFWDYVFKKRYLFPTPTRRWYVRHLVVKPLQEFFNSRLDSNSLEYDAVVMGSRYDDASSRSLKPVYGILNYGNHNLTGLLAVYPIAGLTTDQVRDLVSDTPFAYYNDLYPLRSGAKPGFWAYLNDSTLAYHKFASKLELPGAWRLYSFVSYVQEKQRDPNFLGPRGRRWNDFALDQLRLQLELLYGALSDAYPGLYPSRVGDLFRVDPEAAGW